MQILHFDWLRYYRSISNSHREATGSQHKAIESIATFPLHTRGENAIPPQAYHPVEVAIPVRDQHVTERVTNPSTRINFIPTTIN